MNETKLKRLIQEAVIDALTVDVTLQKMRDEKTGMPLAAPEIKTEKVFLPSFICQHIKFQEGAFRGLQEDITKKNNAINSLTDKVDVIGRVLMGMESSAQRLAALSDAIKLLPDILNESDSEARRDHSNQ